MKKIFLIILLTPVFIFVVGLVVVFGVKGFNALSSSAPSSSRQSVTAPTIIYAPTQYYDATGATVEEIRASMSKSRRDTFLEGHPAVTLVKTNINFTTTQRANTCNAVMSKFDLTITYVYPKWTPPQGAPKELVAKWDSFVAGLVVHEGGHAKIEIERAAILMQELQKMPMLSTCEAFNEAWRAKAGTFEAETNQREAQYDKDTQSGKLQKAIF